MTSGDNGDGTHYIYEECHVCGAINEYTQEHSYGEQGIGYNNGDGTHTIQYSCMMCEEMHFVTERTR